MNERKSEAGAVVNDAYDGPAMNYIRSLFRRGTRDKEGTSSFSLLHPFEHYHYIARSFNNAYRKKGAADFLR